MTFLRNYAEGVQEALDGACLGANRHAAGGIGFEISYFYYAHGPKDPPILGGQAPTSGRAMLLSCALVRSLCLACRLAAWGWACPEPAVAQPAGRYTLQEQDRIQKHRTVRYALYPHSGPFLHVEGHRPRGVAVEYLHAMSRASGLVFQPVTVADIEQAKLALQRREVDLLPVLSSSPNDGALHDWTLPSRPYFVDTAVVITRASATSIVGLRELEGQRVAVRRNGFLHGLLRRRFPAVTPVPVADAGDELAAISSGTADAAVDAQVILLPLWRKRYPGVLHVAGTISDVVLNVRMGVRGDDPTLAAIIDKTLASLTAGETDTILAKWMDDSSYGVPSGHVHVRFHALGIAAALGALVALACLYQRARRDRRRALRNEREKTMFLAVMSHEIRVPLSCVLSCFTLLKQTRARKLQKNLLATASTAADTLLRLTDTLLDLSKLEAGGVPLHKVATDLGRLVRDTVGIVRLQARQKGLALHLHLDVRDDTHVLLDPTRFQQVALNLLSNAIKFTDSGSVTLEVTLSPGGDAAAPHELLVRVIDTGIGIPVEQRTRLFQAYAQADSTIVRRYGGTGLGLSISRQLVERMGGRIGLENRPDPGITISFRLPVELVPAKEACAAPAPPSAAPPRATPLCVLLVEDHPANRFVFEQQLRSIGCLVSSCADGASALRRFNHQAFDLVLMDCDLPHMSGYEVARRLRQCEKHGRHTPILALSASTDAAHKRSCAECGMDGVLRKPLELTLLRSEILARCGIALPDGNVQASPLLNIT